MKLLVILMPFLAVGLLLITNHWGVAIRVSNWLFYVLTILTLYKLLKNEK